LKSILFNRHIGTSGECPICSQDAKDVRHLLFECHVAEEMWRAFGLFELIEEAATTDRSGSGILELVLRMTDKPLPGFDSIQVKETVATVCWYIWWIRRRRTHNEAVPPISKCKMSILAIIANKGKALKRSSTADHWSRPEARVIK
jgi:hypothetical protein